MAVIGIIINGLLLYGTIYDNDVLMLVWMVSMGLKVLVALTLAALNSYFWAVVYSCYRDLTE